MDRRGTSISILVVAALGMSALVPVFRLPLLVGLVVATAVAPRDAAWRWAVAGAIPVGVILSWGSLSGEAVGPLAACADPLASRAWGRVLEAAAVIVAIVVLARFAGTRVVDLGLRRPARNEVALGVAALVVIPIPALYIGAVLAEPFFGRIELDLSDPLAIVPAFTLAIANGTMEELAYRGALMAWLSRAAGPTVGLLGQAAVFGLAHTGADFTGPAAPVVIALAVAGLVAGLIVRRTGSLWFVIVAHIAFDVPLYYAAACRLEVA